MEASASVPVFQPQEKSAAKRVQAYVAPAVKLDLDRLAQVWSEIDGSEWTESQVVKRLIEAALDTAWDELGGKPETEEAFRELLKTAHKRAQKLNG